MDYTKFTDEDIEAWKRDKEFCSKFQIGDIVETCSLMPGVIMEKGDDDSCGHMTVADIKVRQLDKEETFLSSCSLLHCGIVKLTPHQAMQRLFLGKEVLTELWAKEEEYSFGIDGKEWKDYDTNTHYQSLIDEEYEKRLK